MIFMTPDLFAEIRKFLTVNLKQENLTLSCRSKLMAIVSKLEIFNSSIENGDEDYNCYEEPCNITSKPYSTDFELPTKYTNEINDQQNVTLSGSLYHRYNLQCWELYPNSVLVNGRLICYKARPSTYTQVPVTDSAKNSEPSVFLMGYKAILTGKDCGMNFVFKLTHPIEDTKVFAVETEEEAQVWIEQINQYAMAATPSVTRTFQDQSEISEKLSYEVDSVTRFSSMRQQGCGFDNGVKKYESVQLRRQRSEVANIINDTVISNPNFLISDAKFTRSKSNYNVKRQSSYGINSSNLPSDIGGGTNLISSMRRKVESFGNKCRNRKSFAGFSTKTVVSNGTVSNKSRTLSQLSNDDSKRSSICSAQFLPTGKDAIYKGMAKLRVHGNRLGWMERWCQLKPKLLECYHLSTNGSKPTLDFALCLEDLTLGLSNDKKHRSAIRLFCDSIKQDLLFEVQDKVVMGDWIKAFIEALGISKPKTNRSNPNDSLEITIDQNKEEVKNDGSLLRPLTAMNHYGSESIYDEVCPSDYKDNDPPVVINNNSTAVHKHNQRRWSSPTVELFKQISQTPYAPYAARRGIRDHPLPSLPASSTDSENNSDTLPDTPIGNVKYEIESIYDNSSTMGRTHNHSCTSTLKSSRSNPSYPVESSLLKSNIVYADQSSESSNYQNDKGGTHFDFGDNMGCSLADLIARFDPQSENHDTSSATMSSKTDSSGTQYHQYYSQDNIYSMSNSFMSLRGLDRSTHNKIVKEMTRSVSLDNNAGLVRSASIRRTNERDRPRSLLVKNTSLDLLFEELSAIKGDLRNLYKHKLELQRALDTKIYSESQSLDSLNSLISDVTNEISTKESRLKELSNNSRKRFTIAVATTHECH